MGAPAKLRGGMIAVAGLWLVDKAKNRGFLMNLRFSFVFSCFSQMLAFFATSCLADSLSI